ncbi:hypothetical protein K3495_g14354 [Podosphaera aphanis]|nr:hypothetical protein K3495_g14354 [Podosphaera aphanis]
MGNKHGDPLSATHRSIDRPRGLLSLCGEEASPMATHGQGTLASLIQSRSTNSSHGSYRRRSSLVSRAHDSTDDEENNLSPTGDVEDSHEIRTAEERRLETILHGPQMRSQRLIGNSNSRYQWEKYWKTKDELKTMKKQVRKYYERTNNLIQQYIYIDRLLDSSLPHDLLNEYNDIPSYGSTIKVPPTITEEEDRTNISVDSPNIYYKSATGPAVKKIKRTPRELYQVSNETTPLLVDEENTKSPIPEHQDEFIESGSRIVQIAIYINLTANIILLAAKIAVIMITNSLSVLASLVDAALDFLSTAIIWTTTILIERQDHYTYPVGRRRLEPIGVLVFSVIMITSFSLVGFQCIGRLNSGDTTIIDLAPSAIVIMSVTVLVKFACWIWCRLVKNSSVQAMADDAMTDVIFNTFSIIFPLIGKYAQIWWLDALGGLMLSLYIVVNWSRTSTGHIRNLTGAAATADERNVLLYLTMRFAKTIKQIQGLQAYHCGDKLNVEVDIVLDEEMTLRDSHDLGESLQYVLESVPLVDRAFVHQDYAGWNLPTHMQQQAE